MFLDRPVAIGQEIVACNNTLLISSKTLIYCLISAAAHNTFMPSNMMVTAQAAIGCLPSPHLCPSRTGFGKPRVRMSISFIHNLNIFFLNSIKFYVNIKLHYYYPW